MPTLRTAAALSVLTVLCSVALTVPSALGDPPGEGASFTYDPPNPLSGQSVQFTSTSVDTPDNPIVSEQWDLDDDTLYEASGPTVFWSFSSPGYVTVRLHITYANNDQLDTQQTIGVVNRPPTASIAYSPASPRVGQAITFFSTSSDPDGRIVTTVWDLDGDGHYDDGSGVLVTGAYVAPGNYTVRLRVADDRGAADGTSVVVPVLPALDGTPVVVPPGAPLTSSFVRILSPFPIVRISGLVRKHGVKLRLLSVTAPVGSTVSVRCRGHGCPFKSKSTSVQGSAAPGTRLVRIRSFHRGLLRAGSIVRVFVTRQDEIGKYTRLKVRAGKVPARVDRCLAPNSKQPTACPSG